MTDEQVTASERYAGATTEIDHSGDYTVDTTSAVGGDVRVKLGAGRSFAVEIDGNTVFEISGGGGSVRIDLGGSAEQRVVLGDALKDALNAFFTQKYDVHTHPTPTGPSGPPLPLFTGTQITDDQLSDVAFTKKS